MARVRAGFEDLQERIIAALLAVDGTPFDQRVLDNERGGTSRPCVLSGGPVFERAAVNSTFSLGDQLPIAATERRPELVGRSFEAASISIIVHPRNPHVPTTHMNLRFFIAHSEDHDAVPVWWFGGGFDLTPIYGYDQDVRQWHATARAAVAPFGEHLYPLFKAQCDAYFHLPHRQEARGVGGLFFDDLDAIPGRAGRPRPASPGSSSAISFDRCFALTRSVGDHFLLAYLPIVERRRRTTFTEDQRQFQLIRRGRYAEFNLAFDRGTRYGLQVGGRAESILASLPPEVSWRYDWKAEPGSDEERLVEHFLVARDWLAIGDGDHQVHAHDVDRKDQCGSTTAEQQDTDASRTDTPGQNPSPTSHAR